MFPAVRGGKCQGEEDEGWRAVFCDYYWKNNTRSLVVRGLVLRTSELCAIYLSSFTLGKVPNVS